MYAESIDVLGCIFWWITFSI